MALPRVDVRRDRVLVDRIEPMTSEERAKYAAALRRGCYVGRCLRCDAALYEYDDMMVFPTVMCRGCREEANDYQPCA